MSLTTHTSIKAAVEPPSAPVINRGVERRNSGGVEFTNDAITTVLGVVDARWGACRPTGGACAAVDQYAWNLHYDSSSTEFSPTGVDIVAVYDAGKQRNVKLTLTPRRNPQNLPIAGAFFEKYVRPNKSEPGSHLDYDTWVMPFKIVLEG
jgi:hypothetical protein